MRRRRRKSAFSRPSPLDGLVNSKIMIGAGLVAFIALFAFFIHQAKSNPPEQHETRIELPDAFKQ